MSSLLRRFGALELPDTLASVTETLAPLDPGRDILLGLFRQAILSELNAPWQVVTSGTPLAGTAVVQDAWPGPLSPEIVKARVTQWPCLAVYRTGEATYEEHTLEIDRLTQLWSVDYVLGPLAPEDQRRLRDILVAVPKVLSQTIRGRGHPDYENGALQFFEESGRFASVRLVNHEIGAAPFAGEGQPLYHACSVQLETTETDGDVDGVDTDLTGASFAFDVGDNTGFIPNLIEADTDVG